MLSLITTILTYINLSSLSHTYTYIAPQNTAMYTSNSPQMDINLTVGHEHETVISSADNPEEHFEAAARHQSRHLAQCLGWYGCA